MDEKARRFARSGLSVGEVEDLRAALTDARAAIASLPEDALGMAGVSTGDFLNPQSHEWPIRDELLAKIDKALAN